jgi:hypothetical protein
MNHTQILKQAWHNVCHYRALWIFGLILALTTFSWGAAAFYGRDTQEGNWNGITVVTRSGETFFEALRRTIREEIDELDRELDGADRELEFLAQELHIEIESDIRAFLTVLAGVLVVTYVAAKIARYVSEMALIHMVDEAAETGKRRTVRQGLRMGWSRRTWQLFLIDLLINVPAVLAGVLLFALLFSPIPLWVKGSEAVVIASALVTGGLVLLAICIIIVTSAALSLLKVVSRRACALEGLGVVASVRRGYAVVRQNLKNVGITWLLMVGVGLTWPVLLVPLVLALVGAGTLLGGLSGLLVGGLVSLIWAGEAPVFLALTVGVSIFLLVLVAPLAFLSGFREVFVSSTWTLTYRELSALESLEPDRLPELDTSGLEIAPVA